MNVKMDPQEYLDSFKLLSTAKLADENFARLKAEAELAAAKYASAKPVANEIINKFLAKSAEIAAKYGVSQDKINWDTGEVGVPDAPATPAPATPVTPETPPETPPA